MDDQSIHPLSFKVFDGGGRLFLRDDDPAVFDDGGIEVAGEEFQHFGPAQFLFSVDPAAFDQGEITDFQLFHFNSFLCKPARARHGWHDRSGKARRNGR